jgi:hypothetical protein
MEVIVKTGKEIIKKRNISKQTNTLEFYYNINDICFYAGVEFIVKGKVFVTRKDGSQALIIKLIKIGKSKNSEFSRIER